MLEYIETYRCPDCDGAIPLQHVCSRVLPGQMDPIRQCDVWCEHCQKAWSASFKLAGGLWRLHISPFRLSHEESEALCRRLSRPAPRRRPRRSPTVNVAQASSL
jgi:hypothetical protein